MNNFVPEPLNSVLQTQFESLLAVSLIGSAVVIVAMALNHVLRRWLSPRLLYVLWLLVIVRFVLFVVPASPTSFLNLLPETKRPIKQIQSTPSSSLLTFNVIGSPTPDDLLTAGAGSFEAGLADELTARNEGSSFWSALKIAWLAGFAWMSLQLLIRLVRVTHLIACGGTVSTELMNKFNVLRQKLGLPQLIQLRSTDQLEVPAMAGFFRPTVLLPIWCEEELSDRQLEMVLIHELIHIRRRDGFVQLGAHIITMLHWFNPLARVAARSIEVCRELSCDHQVIKLLSKRDDSETPRLYGQTILQIAERISGNTQINSVFVGGFVGNHDDLVKQRIAMLLRSNSKWNMRAAIGVAGVASIMTLIAVGFTSAQTVSTPTPVENEVTELVPCPASTRQPNESIEVVVGSTRKLEFDYRIPELVVDNPEIVAVTPVSSTQIMVSGLKCGKATLQVKNEKHELEAMTILVKPEMPKVKVTATEHADRQYVSIKTKVLAVSRSQLRSLGVDFSAAGRDKRKISGVADIIREKPVAKNTKGSNTGYSYAIVKNPNFDGIIQTLQQHNIAKLLSQPVLVTRNSQAAEVFVGQLVPFKVIDETGKLPTVIEHRQVGIRLNIVPKIHDDQTLTLEIRAEVSEIADDLSGNTGVPGIRVRRINTGMKMRAGETLVLVGNDHENEKGEADSEVVFMITPSIRELSDAKVPSTIQRK